MFFAASLKKKLGLEVDNTFKEVFWKRKNRKQKNWM